ncbi:MAG: DUF4249 domain-containing protein [Tannerella sp.]|jgi:hypothetical protein|nr:DUF4249 domain-containing protein [Tannerella sp.]
MMKRNLFITLVAFSFVFFSCYKEIDLEKYRPEPDLVLNGVISADTVVMLSISRTQFFTDTSRYEVVSDADVSLTVNSVFRETMRWTVDESFHGGGVYLSKYRPQTGDIIRIEAATPNGEVWVEETMPAKVSIEDITFSSRIIYDGKGYMMDENGNWVEVPKTEITYGITFTDNAMLTNYYYISITNSLPNRGTDNLIFSSDPVFVDQISVVDGLFGDHTIMGQGGRPFTDHLFNGRRYTLTVKERDASHYSPGRRITLYAITESYFNYLTTMQRAADAANNTNLSSFGFTEPIRIFTNIQGGVGIMATSQQDTVTIDLGDILKDHKE